MSEEQKDLRDAITQTVEFGNTLSKEITTDLAMGKWSLNGPMHLKQKYAEEIHEKYPQISVEAVVSLLTLGFDPSRQNATMSIGGQLYSVTPEPYDPVPIRADVTIDWEEQLRSPLNGRMLANKHRPLFDIDEGLNANLPVGFLNVDTMLNGGLTRGQLAYFTSGLPSLNKTRWPLVAGVDDFVHIVPDSAERALTYHRNKLRNSSLSGMVAPRGYGGHYAMDDESYMRQLGSIEFPIRDPWEDVYFGDTVSLTSRCRMAALVGGRQCGKTRMHMALSEYYDELITGRYRHVGSRTTQLYRAMGYTSPKLVDTVIRIRPTMHPYFQGKNFVEAPIAAYSFHEEFKFGNLHRGAPWILDIETDVFKAESTNARKSLMAPPTKPGNKGPKKRRHK